MGQVIVCVELRMPVRLAGYLAFTSGYKRSWKSILFDIQQPQAWFYSHLFHVLVNKPDRHCALADGGGDALDRAVPDISRGKYARAA